MKLSVVAGAATGLAAGAYGQTSYPEAEPNDSKADATVVGGAGGLVHGDEITGLSTGSSTVTTGDGSADYFRVKTAADVLRIYRHRLVITTNGGAGHIGTIRGLTQSGSVINPTTDGTAQTSSATSTPARFVQWYGFGKQEEIYFRATGTGSTLDPYTAAYERQDVVATDVGTFIEGDITLSNATGNTFDTDVWVYDGNFNAIPDYGADNGNILTRSYAPGVYYIAWAPFNFANHLPAPSGDFQGTVLDFPNAASVSTTSTHPNSGIKITDLGGAVEVGLSRDLFEVNWLRMTVAPAAPAACCRADGTCAMVGPTDCTSNGGIFQGVGSTCGGVVCPPTGACCLTAGSCSQLIEVACAGVWGGAGSACGDCPSVYTYTGGPVGIGTGTSTACTAALASITVPDSYTLSGVSAGVWVTHTWQGDLTMTLTHVDTGTSVIMVERPGVPEVSTVGFSSDNYGNGTVSPVKHFFLSDAASMVYDVPQIAAPGIANVSGQWKPENPLSAFLGENSAGTWTLEVKDCAAVDTGTLQEFILLLSGGGGGGPSCYANCDNSTNIPFLNVADFTCFLQKFAATDPYTNCDQSTSQPTLNVADFTCFLQKFAAGCSAP